MADDLFVWINALWNKTTPEGTPPMRMIHRFLASDQQMAQVARYLQQEFRRELGVMFRVWQGMLPYGRQAPRNLKYVAPKKPPEADALVERMATVLAERREVVEDMLGIFELEGRVLDVYRYFGIEPPARASDFNNLTWTSGPLSATEAKRLLEDFSGEADVEDEDEQRPRKRGGLLDRI